MKTVTNAINSTMIIFTFKTVAWDNNSANLTERHARIEECKSSNGDNGQAMFV